MVADSVKEHKEYEEHRGYEKTRGGDEYPGV
jgi:hypothetical protein